MGTMKLAPHETIEVRELISQEILGIKKVSASIDMVISKGWYPAQDEPMQQLQKDYEDSKDLT